MQQCGCQDGEHHEQGLLWHEVELQLADDATRLREYLADAKSVRMLGS